MAYDFWRINERWISEIFAMEAADRRLLEHPKTAIVDRGGEVLFALDSEGHAVGTCALVRHSADSAELAKMGVDKGCQSGGVGKLLGTEVLKLAQEMGFKKVFLETNSKLAAAIRLYKRLGFVEMPFPVASDYARADIYMECAVPSADS